MHQSVGAAGVRARFVLRMDSCRLAEAVVEEGWRILLFALVVAVAVVVAEVRMVSRSLTVLSFVRILRMDLWIVAAVAVVVVTLLLQNQSSVL